MTVKPVTAVIATRNRPESLRATLDSLRNQGFLPAEIVVVDASDDEQTKVIVAECRTKLASVTNVQWFRADVAGAAPQRNQGVSYAKYPVIWFFDDDIRFEQDCADRLWNALHADASLGGVSAMIVNQRYHSPGRMSRLIFALMHGHIEQSFAGKVIGPAINLLPEDRDDLPEVVPVEWLNTTCTMYRQEALPSPPFDSYFTGYSLMEDVALSLRVAQQGWKLVNCRTARIFHDSQPGDYKSDIVARAQMELVNRHYITRDILAHKRFADYLRLVIWELFQLVSSRMNPRVILGKMRGLSQIWTNG